MFLPKTYCVYIMSGSSTVLYIGVTNDLIRRVAEHKAKKIPGFTQRYSLTKLIYFEQTDTVLSAIKREKELKGWKRERKLALIQSVNINLKDISDGWYEE